MQEQCLDTNVSLKIPFESAVYASLASEVLNVDQELKGSGIKRTITTSGGKLIINLDGQDLKRLRVSANAVLKSIILVTKTLNQFEIQSK